MERELTHITRDGGITMVDVGEKPATKRVALAEAYVHLSQNTMSLLKNQALPKGDALACARVGGILAAKDTSRLIPLCHSLNTTFVDVRFEILDNPPRIRIESEARCTGETGVEMEAIVAAEMAAAIIYDMCKAVQRDITIDGIRLLYKNGGRSGEYCAQGFSL
ncbi:MAG: cyclic pyranopterin monophosphate synthase MoaC [Desulfovibrio sp.]|nr:cyclic pyranopterin monophosphate synthase MoaC [Desulfovibrio sp.]